MLCSLEMIFVESYVEVTKDTPLTGELWTVSCEYVGNNERVTRVRHCIFPGEIYVELNDLSTTTYSSTSPDRIVVQQAKNGKQYPQGVNYEYFKMYEDLRCEFGNGFPSIDKLILIYCRTGRRYIYPQSFLYDGYVRLPMYSVAGNIFLWS